MIARYSTKDISYIWSQENKYKIWYELEKEICKVSENYNLVPKGTYQLLPDNIDFNLSRILEIEKVVKHDVIAFITYLEEIIGEPAKYLHKGITSSDILDTSFSFLLVKSTYVIKSKLDKYINALEDKALKYKDTVTIGRSHGIHAEPITFGQVLASHLAEAKRNKDRLQNALEEISFGQVSGAVGTYAHLSPQIEKEVVEYFRLNVEPVSTQIIPRDRYAFYFSTLAIIASGIERLATNIRHLQRTEVGEVEEYFSSGQKGSSAMPHKRNPVVSENLCGLARMMRSFVNPALENITLWHERDISHSSVERHIAPDATGLLAYMLEKATALISDLIVYEDKMQSNLDKSNNLIYSEAVMLALIKTGLSRQESYSLVQRNAMDAFVNKKDFKQLICKDADISSRLKDSEIEDCFNLKSATRHCNEIINRV
jgi:adenylosuccinate lyase